MDVKLPKLGEGAESGTIVSVAVKEGDRVSKGQTIIELENEKAVAPIPSPADGIVQRIRVKEGDKISIGQLILVLGESGQAPAAAPAAAPAPSRRAAPPVEEPEPAPAPEPEAPVEAAAPAAESEEVEELPAGMAPAASPTLRRLARDLGIDLRRIRGSERGGRIVMSDIKAYILRLEKLAAQGRKAPAAAAQPAARKIEQIDFSQWGPVTQKPLSALRQTISRRMSESWNTIPHVTQFDDADITLINNLRKQHAAAYEAAGARLTVTSFVLQAVATVLRKYPIFNSSLDEVANAIVFKDYCHLGLAVDTEQGLIVPVIRDADKKNLLQLSVDIQALADKARTRKLTREDMQGGTFTISNQGGLGGAHFTPIINKPEVAILGLGRAAQKPVIREGQIQPRLLMPLGLSYDHRLIDGGSAARFITDLVSALESFRDEDVKAALPK